MINEVFLGLGANLGSPKETIEHAIELLDMIQGVRVNKVSRLYKTSPVSLISQPDYINAVCSLKTRLDSETFFLHIQDIEKILGKTPKPKFAPRLADIDILLYGKQKLKTENLTIPHPEMLKRHFVLYPMMDITPLICYPKEDGKTQIISIKKWLEMIGNPNQEKVVLV